MDLIGLLQAILTAIKNYKTGTNYQALYEAAEQGRVECLNTLNQATDLANQIFTEFENKRML